MNKVSALPESWKRNTLLVIWPKKMVFYTVFFLVFCFSGLFTMVGIIWGGFDYRMGLVSLLVILVILLYGVKVDGVFLAYGALTGIVCLSGLYNYSSLGNIALFLRILAFSYLIYRLVDLYIRPENITRVIKWCVAIAVVQLPIIVLQQLLYNSFPATVKARVSSIDIGFGTFNFKGDAPMAFFMVLLIVFLLFDTRRNHIVKYKWFVLFWLSLTVLLSNVNIMRVSVLLIWGVYLVSQLQAKTIIYSVLIFAFLVGILSAFGILGKISENLAHSLVSNTSVNLNTKNQFLSGSYGRGAAIDYYLHRDISFLGDGPSKYYDPFSRAFSFGNFGHIFTFYSEVGLLGWLLSVWIFVFIAFPKYRGHRMVTWVSLLSFAMIQLLSFTTQTMNDISVVLAYCIISKTYLIPLQRPKIVEDLRR